MLYIYIYAYVCKLLSHVYASVRRLGSGLASAQAVIQTEYIYIYKL